ncbi:MAG: prefoldin subunit alpha [Candidatus Woesearchaeota archaeon]|nr:MAG: prefoldin subunit alpha [Candidatus Woesearchaeota archaeon]
MSIKIKQEESDRASLPHGIDPMHLAQSIEFFEEQKAELELALSALHEYELVEDGTEMLVPLATGIFLPGIIKKSSTAVVSVGADTAVEKKVEDIRAFLEERLQELTKHLQELVHVYEHLMQGH